MLRAELDPGANRRDRLVICTGVSVRNGRLTLAGHKWRPRHMSIQSRLQSVIAVRSEFYNI
jgi:hypothetical protein